MSCNLVNSFDVVFLREDGLLSCALDFFEADRSQRNDRRNIARIMSDLRMRMRRFGRVIVGFLRREVIISNLQLIRRRFLSFTALQCCGAHPAAAPIIAPADPV